MPMRVRTEAPIPGFHARLALGPMTKEQLPTLSDITVDLATTKCIDLSTGEPREKKYLSCKH